MAVKMEAKTTEIQSRIRTSQAGIVPDFASLGHLTESRERRKVAANRRSRAGPLQMAGNRDPSGEFASRSEQEENGMRSFAMAAIVLIASPALAQEASKPATYSTELTGAEGTLGQVELADTPGGVILHLSIPAGALKPGMHAVHFHEKGDCSDAPAFKASGGHYNPTGHQHGILTANGMHAGDMPNFMVVEGAKTEVELFNTQLRFSEDPAPLMDADGSALIIHEGTDDYQSQPSGDAGTRVACAVISKK